MKLQEQIRKLTSLEDKLGLVIVYITPSVKVPLKVRKEILVILETSLNQRLWF